MPQNWIQKSSYLTKIFVAGFIFSTIYLLFLSIIYNVETVANLIQKFLPEKTDEPSRYVNAWLILGGFFSFGLMVSLLSEFTDRILGIVPYCLADKELQQLQSRSKAERQPNGNIFCRILQFSHRCRKNHKKFEIDMLLASSSQRLPFQEIKKDHENHCIVASSLFSFGLTTILGIAFGILEGKAKIYLISLALVPFSAIYFTALSKRYWLTFLFLKNENKLDIGT